MLPIGNTSGNQIVQSPGIVVIRNEMIHEARIVHVDGRPHVGAAILSYMGDSRGKWEGSTLVVETTNFSEHGGINRASSHAARMTERFTRSDDRTLRYQVTVDDPATWTQTMDGRVSARARSELLSIRIRLSRRELLEYAFDARRRAFGREVGALFTGPRRLDPRRSAPDSAG